MPRRGSRRRPVTALAILLAVAAVSFVLASPLPASGAAPTPKTGGPAGSAITATVTWNGVDISTLGTVSSALALDFSQSANLNYSWNNAPAPGINIARLQMFYFGFAVSTRDVTLNIAQTHSNGIPLNWTPLSIGYVLEGVYRLTASLIAPNGTTMWSSDFYVRGNAPLGFVAVIPIVLLVLGIYEVYGLATSGRYAMLGRKPETAPPSSTTGPPPGSSPSSEGSPAGESTPPEAESTPPDAPPPPTGGSS